MTSVVSRIDAKQGLGEDLPLRARRSTEEYRVKRKSVKAEEKAKIEFLFLHAFPCKPVVHDQSTHGRVLISELDLHGDCPAVVRD